jgi:hypothetical protein
MLRLNSRQAPNFILVNGNLPNLSSMLDVVGPLIAGIVETFDKRLYISPGKN